MNFIALLLVAISGVVWSGGALDFGFQRFANVTYKTWMRSSIDLKIIAGFSKAQLSIYCAAHNIYVAVVLSIVLPPADRA